MLYSSKGRSTAVIRRFDSRGSLTVYCILCDFTPGGSASVTDSRGSATVTDSRGVC